jgi:hypothetical protein
VHIITWHTLLVKQFAKYAANHHYIPVVGLRLVINTLPVVGIRPVTTALPVVGMQLVITILPITGNVVMTSRIPTTGNVVMNSRIICTANKVHLFETPKQLAASYFGLSNRWTLLNGAPHYRTRDPPGMYTLSCMHECMNVLETYSKAWLRTMQRTWLR